LAALYTNQQLPGIGASLGLDRLLAGMEELGLLPKTATPAEVFIPYFDAGRLHDYLRLARQLRAAGLRVEIFPEPKKLGQQLKYADRKGFRAAVVAGENEFAAGTVQVKNLASATSETVPLSADAAELIEALRRVTTSA
jgi:histidyl-tRNA synthetase